MDLGHIASPCNSALPQTSTILDIVVPSKYSIIHDAPHSPASMYRENLWLRGIRRNRSGGSEHFVARRRGQK